MRKEAIITLSLAAALCCSCNLTLIPEDTVSPESYFKTASDFELWTNAFYTQFSSADDLAGLNADDVIDNNAQDCIKDSRSAATETWSWTQLRNINYMLQNASQCTDAAVRERWCGVAYFFRAYFYFVKVRRYGDVPWYTEPIGSSETDLLEKARDDRGYVMYQVMKDFDRAIASLPATKDVSQVNKWTALAFKSRAALYEGTFRKYHGIGDIDIDEMGIGADWFLRQAADAAEQLMSGAQYKLATGDDIYRTMFVDEDANTDEYILARVYGDILAHDVRHNSVGEKQAFTRRFMNHYQLRSGKSITTRSGYETEGFAAEVKDRDPRLAQTVYCGTSTVLGDTPEYMNGVTGYQPIKYESIKTKNSSGKGTFDFPLMRLPEVYLNFAEAKAELGTLTQADLDKSVNLIRARVGMPSLNMQSANSEPDALMMEYYPNVTKSANTGVILEIRRERTIELVMEGNRQWDMFRWKEGAQMVNHDNPYLGVYFPGTGTYDFSGNGKYDVEIYQGSRTSSVSVFRQLGSDIYLTDGTRGRVIAYPNVDYTWNEDRDYLWPIPATQRVLNHNLKQNPGWADGLSY